MQRRLSEQFKIEHTDLLFSKPKSKTVKKIMWKINPSTSQFTYSIGQELPQTEGKIEFQGIRENMCYKSRKTIPVTA